MKKLNRDLEIAIEFTYAVAASERLPVWVFAVSQGISVLFLEQIARKLRKGGVLKSVRGPGGGFEIASVDVTLNTVFTAMGCSGIVTAMQKLLPEIDLPISPVKLEVVA